MSIMLGNLTVLDIEYRTGIAFPQEIREFMWRNHQPNASEIGPGQWHCFDIPFLLVCGDMDTATKIYESVKDRADEFKVELSISIK